MHALLHTLILQSIEVHTDRITHALVPSFVPSCILLIYTAYNTVPYINIIIDDDRNGFGFSPK